MTRGVDGDPKHGSHTIPSYGKPSGTWPRPRSAEVMLGSPQRLGPYQEDPIRLDQMHPPDAAWPLSGRAAIREADASATAAVKKCERLASDASQDGPVVEVSS